ncbi:Adenylate kinase 5, chloroplastic [Glycine soja]|uniref:adenylate kinase n=1 Tax=Glycine soja TaxID=3848 RepID=A0A445IZ19_GLYSO|nr:Adenylate kinase 5, chloroplastic [Glycine soja]
MLNSTPTSFYRTTTLTPSPLLSTPLPSSSSCTHHHSCLHPRHFSFHSQPLRLSNLRCHTHLPSTPKTFKLNCSISEPLKVMISGAPASGKGTQCELIVQKFGLVHISTGDLLRAEVGAGTEIGNKAKEFMNAGQLVPDEIVTAMVAARLTREDAKQTGWLLDGYPRSYGQAQSLEKMQIRPNVYIVLDVPDEILIDRCVGRRLDPVTGKIYHLKFFPPDTEEIKARLITRPDDTEEKVKSRLNIYKQNAEAASSVYSSITHKIDGSQSKEAVFKEIESLLSQLQQDKVKIMKSEATFPTTTNRHFFGDPLSQWIFLFVVLPATYFRIPVSPYARCPSFWVFFSFTNAFHGSRHRPLPELLLPFCLVIPSPILSSIYLHDGGDGDLIIASRLSHTPFLYALYGLFGSQHALLSLPGHPRSANHDAIGRRTH